MAFTQVSPYFRSPWTDMTAGLLSHQLDVSGDCARREMDAADCIEAYGVDRGLRKCKDLIDDYMECHKKTKQLKRFLAMREEREKQIAEGKLTGNKKFVSPRVDSY